MSLSRRLFCLTLLCLSAVLAGPAVGQEKKEPPTPAERLAIADKATPGLVIVEYTLQFDKGEAPLGRGKDMETMIREERPMEVEGWLLGPTEVVTRDIMVHPRFIKGTAVRFGDQVVSAKMVGCFKRENAMLLKLDQPLAKAKPLDFKPDSKGPYYYVDHTQADGHWTVTVLPVEMNTVSRSDAGRKFIISTAIYSLVVDKEGNPVGLQMKTEYPLDDSWKGSPLKWPMVGQDDLDKLVKGIQARADQALLRVKIHFRSPRKEAGGYGSGAGGPTEHTCAGLLIEPRKLLVLANFDPKLTARLERVVIYPVTGEPVNATFAGSMTDYGCFLATLDKPLPGPMKLPAEAIEKCRDNLLLAIDMRLQGDQRVVYCVRDRISRFDLGWKRRLYPESYSDDYLFDAATGELVALPVAHREKLAVRERYSGRSQMMPAAYLAEALADGAKALDPANVPLTEEEENRLAWLGIEFQAMDAELARANKCSDETHNGTIGAMVAWVYPDSPAAKAGVQEGWILVRLIVPDQPKPIDVKLDYYRQFWRRPVPWEQWDRLTEDEFDLVPPPWPPVESSIVRTLTDLGFGKKFKAQFWVNGEMVTKEFTIEQSPAHYDTAPRYAAKDLGLTVRDMTYEARRYYQKKADDPGVIVTKIERGSKASVRGIKPFELVTKVNDQPVKNVKDFEKLVNESKGEVTLYIARMARGRPVKIDLTASGATTRPAKSAPTVDSEDMP